MSVISEETRDRERGVGRTMMGESEGVRLVLRFVNEINRHDVEGLVSLISYDHRFVDALGHEVRGKEKLRRAWQGYFELFPDYHVEVRETLQNGRDVAIFGTASGTLAHEGQLLLRNHWEVPAAWRAVIDRGLVIHWQVYTDNEPARKIMAENARA